MYKSKQNIGKRNGTICRFAIFLVVFTLFCSVFSLFNYSPVHVSAETTDNTTTDDIRNLQNGSFEEGQTWTDKYKQPLQKDVPAWNTTAFQGKIELFRENTGTYISGVTLAPSDGEYAAELNADEESTLYQNIKTSTSSVYEWGLDHGARNGTDTMALVIGPKQTVDPSKPDKNGRDQFMQMVDWLIAQGLTSVKTSAGLGEKLIVYSKKFAANGTFEDNAGNNAFSLTPSTIYTEEWHIWIMASSKATTGTNPWNSYGSNADNSTASGSSTGNKGLDLSKYYLYTVPAGQTETVFGFVSVGVDKSAVSGDKAKTYGNFIDNIKFELYHPLSGSTTTHGSVIIGGSDGSTGGEGSSEGHKVTIDDKLATYVIDGEPLKIQAIVKKADSDAGCEFVGLYYTKQESGKPVTTFLKLAGNEIEYSDSLTEEEKKGKWVKSTNADGDIIYTYYLNELTSATDLQFVFLKSPTVTYDPNGGKAYVVEREYNKDEAENVYSFKPVPGDESAQAGTGTLFIDPYVSHAAEGQDDGWKFMGWLLTGDTVDNVSADIQVNADKLGTLILPAEHTIACDFALNGVKEDKKAQYFKIYNGKVASFTKTINKDVDNNKDVGVTWTDNGETTASYANVHKGLTMVAQWRWRQVFQPQVHNATDDNYINSSDGGTVEIIGVTDTDENYNAAYNDKGGKSYHAETDETVIVKATANEGYNFVGWYDENEKPVSTNAEYSYVETKESVNTYYARFSNSVTQTYIRQVGSGDTWEDTENDAIGTLGRYTYTDAVGMPISSTATAKNGYKFVGWYDSEGNKVADNMLTNNGATISYTTTGNATYYARFQKTFTHTYIRQVKNGDKLQNINNNDTNTIGNLTKYTCTDVADTKVSSTATAGSFYKFVGWYNSEDNLITENKTINHPITGTATYYARFEMVSYTLTISKIDGNKSTTDNKVPLEDAEFTLYKKDSSGDEPIDYNGNRIMCKIVRTDNTVLSEDKKKATAVFDEISPDTEYYLKETKVPTGYQLLDSPLKITFDYSDNSVQIEGINGISKDITENEINIELTNYLIPIIMPSTGTSFTGEWFIVAGLLMIIAAAIGLFWIKISCFKQK